MNHGKYNLALAANIFTDEILLVMSSNENEPNKRTIVQMQSIYG
jgi:hypothetical protein